MSIVEFLEARLAEDEAIARTWDGHTWEASDEGVLESGTNSYVALGQWGVMDEDAIAHMVRHQPARVLREVAAKRAIIEECGEIVEADEWTYVDATGTASLCLSALAAIYADHPDFDPAWIA